MPNNHWQSYNFEIFVDLAIRPEPTSEEGLDEQDRVAAEIVRRLERLGKEIDRDFPGLRVGTIWPT